MRNIDAPVGSAGGGTDAPDPAGIDPARIATALPARLRVYALAKLLSVPSKEVVATLADLGEAVRSAQASIDRETALRVVQALLPEPAGGRQAADATATGALEVDDPGAPAVPLAPVFNPPAPVFLPPPRRRRPRRRRPRRHPRTPPKTIPMRTTPRPMVWTPTTRTATLGGGVAGGVADVVGARVGTALKSALKTAPRTVRPTTARTPRAP